MSAQAATAHAAAAVASTTTTSTTPTTTSKDSSSIATSANNNHDSNSTNSTATTNTTTTSLPTKSLSVSGLSSGTKVNQAAFIHKLYSMLEDDSIKHLISWTPSNVSFVISPGEEFSKVLSQYFKHTNPSSFVRQLNMYGFHKVNETFQGNSSSSTTPSENHSAQWEFKHGAGSFKRGDVESLRAIKRRTSRPSAIHRDNISLKPVALSVPSTPSADYAGTPPPQGPSSPVPGGPQTSSPVMQQQALPQPQYLPQHHNFPYYPPPDNYLEARISSLEHSLWTLRSTNSMLLSKYNNLVESCKRSQSDNIYLVDIIAKIVALHESPKQSPLKQQDLHNDLSTINFELTQIRNTLQMHTSNISHLSLDDHQVTAQHPAQQPAGPSPVYSFPRRQPLHQNNTKNEMTSSSGARERAPSIFYDPLAPAPNPSSPRQHTEDNAKPIPTSAPQPPSTFFNHRQSAPGGLSFTSQRGSPANSTPSSPVPHHADAYGPPPPFHYPFPQHQPSSQPQSPQFAASVPHQHAPPTSTPQHHYYGEPPASPSSSMNSSHAPPGHSMPPSRDQRPGSFPFVSSYHSQRQQSYMGGPLIPSSNPYSLPSSNGSVPGSSNANSGSNPGNTVAALSSAGKVLAEAMAPYRRHTSSEIIINPSKPAHLSAVPSSVSAPISINSPPNSTSRHNSFASSNSSASSAVANSGAATTSSAVGTPSSSSPFSHSSPQSKKSEYDFQKKPELLTSSAGLPPLRSTASSVQSLLNPTTTACTTGGDIGPDRKRLKVI